jgi:hypothetical protein
MWFYSEVPEKYIGHILGMEIEDKLDTQSLCEIKSKMIKRS